MVRSGENLVFGQTVVKVNTLLRVVEGPVCMSRLCQTKKTVVRHCGGADPDITEMISSLIDQQKAEKMLFSGI